MDYSPGEENIEDEHRAFLLRTENKKEIRKQKEESKSMNSGKIQTNQIIKCLR